MKKVLILGNGNSRLLHQNFINTWNGEIWGCNRIFYELGKTLPKLDILAGDYAALCEAVADKKESGKQFKMLAKNFKKEALKLEDVKPFNIPKQYQNDTGTTLVAKALLDNYDKIYICGFDLGGPDVYMEKHQYHNKSNWIQNWRRLDNDFGLDKVQFIGVDHKPFIQSNKKIDSYAMLYQQDQDHLGKRVLILGNGISRNSDIDKKVIHNWNGEIWGCNKAYTENLPFTRIGTVHKEVALDALQYKKKHNRQYEVWCKDYEQKGIKKFYIQNKGGNTGYLFIKQALYEEFDEIVLSGFDFGGEDFYTEYKVGTAFQRRFEEIKDEDGLSRIRFLHGMPDFLL